MQQRHSSGLYATSPATHLAPDRLERAIALARELERMLCVEVPTSTGDGFRIRLARAQALGVIDVLLEVVGESSSALEQCAS